MIITLLLMMMAQGVNLVYGGGVVNFALATLLLLQTAQINQTRYMLAYTLGDSAPMDLRLVPQVLAISVMEISTRLQGSEQVEPMDCTTVSDGRMRSMFSNLVSLQPTRLR